MEKKLLNRAAVADEIGVAIKYAEKRRDECAKRNDTPGTRYWVGYIDGAKAVLLRVATMEAANEDDTGTEDGAAQ